MALRLDGGELDGEERVIDGEVKMYAEGGEKERNPLSD